MINRIKRNKLFAILLISTLVVFILALFLTSMIDLDTKKEIYKRVISIYNSRDKQLEMLTKHNIQIVLFQNTGLLFIIWLLGISIVGIPLILLIYFFKVLLLAWNCYFLLIHIKIHTIPFFILYLLSSFIFIILAFIVVYYAVSYSIILVRTLFFKKVYSLQKITTNYIKILLGIILISILFCFFEVYIIPKILLFF